ncbi:hypothetical protein AVEN_92081-1 [Araneus ventricosus]|uniref:Uncharacterized protein n=1 Tax=Araneus ventricosus TaxID=182803 RepID=A0A4Y2QWU1_ARAVE|nr:hypothetical protein AVEN_92081-1 [Araneus ventricosus]
MVESIFIQDILVCVNFINNVFHEEAIKTALDSSLHYDCLVPTLVLRWRAFPPLVIGEVPALTPSIVFRVDAKGSQTPLWSCSVLKFTSEISSDSAK